MPYIKTPSMSKTRQSNRTQTKKPTTPRTPRSSVRFQMVPMSVPEKKRDVWFDASAQSVGQVNGNNSGHFVLDITPVPAQGSSQNTRIGSMIKWCSSYFQLQFYQQANANNPIKGRIYLVAVKGIPQTSATTFMSQFFDPNLFISNATGGASTVYDLYSQRDQDYFKDFQVLLKKDFYVAADPAGSQTMIKTVEFGAKFPDRHVRWSANTATVSAGQVYMIIVTDNGNVSASTTSTISAGVPSLAQTSGLTFNYNWVHYFQDN